jgi:uncharacterized protein YqhQ
LVSLFRKHLNMIISVIIGLCIWFVIPILLENNFKKKKNKAALRMMCKIVGLVIVIAALINGLV